MLDHTTRGVAKSIDYCVVTRSNGEHGWKWLGNVGCLRGIDRRGTGLKTQPFRGATRDVLDVVASL